MKVLIITNVFPNSAEETRGIFTYQIVSALQKKCDVHVVAPLPWVPPFIRNLAKSRYPHAEVPGIEKIGDITVHHPRYLVIPKILGFMHPFFMYFPLLKLIRKLVQNDRIDLINAHWIFPDGVAATWVARKFEKPIVLTSIGCDANYYPTLLFRKSLIRRVLHMADAVTLKSNSLKEKILELKIPNKKIFVIPNGTDLQRFRIMDRSEARRQLGIRGKGPILLTVGSLDEVKGIRYLLEALKSMAKDGLELPHLIMVGDGPLKHTLITQAQGYGIANKITFLGRRLHNEIPLWMNAADLFCLPSIREGRPNALMEAIACGTPVVASNVGSVPEIICEGNGLIARPRDPKSLSIQILSCLNRSWDREFIRHTLSGWTWDQCAASYMKVFQKFLPKVVDQQTGNTCAV